MKFNRKHIACLFAMASVFCVFSSKTYANESQKALKGVYIENIDIANMTEADAKRAVKSYVESISDQKVTLAIGSEKVSVQASELGYKWANKEVVDDAVSYGQSGNIVARYKANKDLEHGNKVYSVEMEVKKNMLESGLEKVIEEFGSTAKNASLELTDNGFKVIPEKNGYVIDKDEASKVLYDYMKEDWATDSVGLVKLPTTEEKAQVTSEDCEKVSDEPLGSYTTTFSVSTTTENRNKNIENGCKKLDGLVLYPGDEISCNEMFLPFTAENGYYEAGAFINGEVSTDIGGGICQVSTTLYNALLRAEVEITERLNHSMTVNYVPLAADAAITGDYKDLKFKNDTDAPLYIEGIFSWGGSIKFNVYGHETRPANRTLEFESETVSKKEPEVKITKDNTKPEGYEEIVTAGYTGYVAKLWKYVFIDGQLEDKILINTSTYKATPTEKIVGTAKKEKTTKKKDETKKDGESSDGSQESSSTKANGESTTPAQSESTTPRQSESTTPRQEQEGPGVIE
ncbi:MAG TPA: hypothetical protein DCW44_07665 [Eubacterium sp.]|nr:hypothetical protein [Eubacterium sp.]